QDDLSQVARFRTRQFNAGQFVYLESRRLNPQRILSGRQIDEPEQSAGRGYQAVRRAGGLFGQLERGVRNAGLSRIGYYANYGAGSLLAENADGAAKQYR